MNENSHYKQRAAKQAKADQPRHSSGYVKWLQAALGHEYRVLGEVRFHAQRKWRLDCVVVPLGGDFTPISDWPGDHLAVEIDGAIYSQGRHVRGIGREKDMEKDYHAMRVGYRVLHVSPGMLKDGRAVEWIKELLK